MRETADGPVRTLARAPAAVAAACFVAGVWLGSWAQTGAAGSLVLVGCCGTLLCLRVAARRGGGLSRTALCLLWASLGLFQGRLRIAAPAEIARRSFAALPQLADRADRLDGVLVDFWTGAPPHVHGRMRAERLWREGSWRPFPAEVFLFVSGEQAPERLADRGDRVLAVGHLQPEGLPASDRDLALPWPSYRFSVKSTLRLEPRGRTTLSLLTLPNRWLAASFPPRGSRGAEFDRDVRGPLSALLLGRTTELDRGMVGRYRRGGLYHLLVVSGLHVALAAGLALALLRLAGMRGRARALALLGVVGVFVLVGGANPPAVRAGLVLAIHLASRLLERPIDGMQALGLSALILFGAAPGQIFSIGTILTFAAVCGITLLTAPIRSRLPRRPASLFSALAAALAAQAATAPILLWRFNLVSAGAWLTAPLSVPLSGALIGLGALLLACFTAGFFAVPAVFLFAQGSRCLEWFAERASGVAFLRPTPPLEAVLLVSSLTLVGALAIGRLRRGALAAAALLFLWLALRPGPSGPLRGFRFEALDVGQGDALLLRWGRRAMLVDGGGPFDLDARDFGRTRLLPKLLDRGVTRLDAALLTHPHPDHALGLFAVLEELPVSVFWRSAGEDEGALFSGLEEVARSRGIPARALQANQLVRWPDASLAVLHSGGTRRKIDATNNQSVVAVFERDGRRAFLTGDAGAATESELLRARRVPRADVLKIGHHGSRGSTTPPFLAAVSPRLALISCGRGNRFGHPAPETLRTLLTLRVPVLRTDLLSDLRVELLPRATRLSYRGVL